MVVKNIGIFGRNFEDVYNSKIDFLLKDLSDKGFSIHIFEPFHDFLSARISLNNHIKVFDRATWDARNIDFLICIGGDGTFLDSTTFVRDSEIPILGINTGRLGFLSGASIKELEIIADSIHSNNFEIYKRATLKVESEINLFNENNFALNELTIHKNDTSSMVKIHTYINNDFLNSYWADGLIISTPTGSTAYSLSCGGPIIFPGSNNFVITPVAPHNLNMRPIVIPDHKSIKLEIEGRSKFFLVSLDSRSETIDSTVQLTISKNNFFINLARLKSHTYLSTIRNKLNWGLDQRNNTMQ